MNDNTLFQNMEILKEKFKISYKEAREVLESHDNNLIESLIFLEEIYSEPDSCQVKSYLNNIKNKLVELYKEGINQRIIISRKDEVIADIPLTAVVISSFAFILYPILIPIKLGSVLLFELDIKIVDKLGNVYHVNSDVKDKMNQVFSTSKDKISDMVATAADMKLNAEEFRNKAVEFGKKAMEDFNDLVEAKISKTIKDKTSDYAKFVYDAENDEVKEEYDYENNEDLEKEQHEDVKVEDSNDEVIDDEKENNDKDSSL